MNSGVKLRNQYNETLDPTQPLVVADAATRRVVEHTETLIYNGKAAAGAVTINSTAQKPVVTVEGDQVASHWELEKNKVYEALVDSQAKPGTPRLQAVTETNGSADITIYDDAKDLEALFESATTTVKRFVAKVIDKDGNSLYGWIFGVAASSNVYTIDVVNNRLTETQNWVGTLGNFDNTSLQKVEIYRYNSPISFGTGTTLTEEVQCPREYSKSWEQVLNYAIRNLSNGQYFVDYMRGRIVGKKADATASEAITYNALDPAGERYQFHTVRTSAVLTNGYVAGTVIDTGGNDNQLIIYADFTKGNLTTAEIKVEFSDDNSDYYQETFQAIAAGVATETLGVHQMSATGKYRFLIPIKDRYIKISSNGTGDVANSLMEVYATTGQV